MSMWVEVGLTDVPKHMCVHPLARTCKQHSDHIRILFFHIEGREVLLS